jgi:hypothetical protein
MLSRGWLALVCLIIFFSGVSFSLAAPTITGPPSSILHNQNVTVTGVGFGVKSTPGPIVWDNFENGTAGSDIPGKAPIVENMAGAWTWASTGGDIPTYSKEVVRAGASTQSSLHNYLEGLYGNAGLRIGNIPYMQTWYISFWWYFDNINSVWSRNTKPFFIDGSNSSNEPHTYIGFGQVGNDPGLRNNIGDSTSISGAQIAWGSTTIDSIEGEWVRIEAVLKQSSPNTANGEYHVWIHRPNSADPKIIYDLKKNPTATRAQNDFWNKLNISSYSSRDNGATQRAFVDDFYFDSTPARVELGNSPSWNGCTKREIQIPSNWSDSAITFKVNQGSFLQKERVYLYVVDANGSISNNGQGVEFPINGTVVDENLVDSLVVPPTPDDFRLQQ